MARNVVNSRLRFARNNILVENNRFRTSQLARSAGTLAVILKNRNETTENQINKNI